MVLIVACGLQMSATAQENSPYSRYGLGDLTPNHNGFTRGMGGIAAGIADNSSINSTNPASLPKLQSKIPGVLTYTIFDVGAEIDYRTLKTNNAANKFTSANTYISYLQLAFPLTTPKMKKKDMYWGMSVGLKPVSKINYKIEKSERTPLDSLHTLYEGTGGSNQAFLGTGLSYKNFRIGVNAGYMFGKKDYSTKLTFLNDSVSYFKSNSGTTTSFGGLFFDVGLQYDIVLKTDAKKNALQTLTIGAYGNMQQSLNANSDLVRETIFYDGNGNPIRLDSVYEEKDVKGKIKYPAMVGIGGVYQDANWLIGADFEYGIWSSYRYYGQNDEVQNNWTGRVGVQYYPLKQGASAKKYFNFVRYRIGAFYGTDYIKTNNNRPQYGITVGAGMPLTSLRQRTQDLSFVVLNTGIEYGNRGNKQTNLRENIIRFNIGLAMNAPWFRKQKYR